MNEQERMDRQLREAFGGERPRLSPAFDARLRHHLRERRLNPVGRWMLIAYAVVAIAASIWTMRSAGLGWGPVAIALGAPLILLATLYRRRLVRPSDVSSSPSR